MWVSVINNFLNGFRLFILNRKKIYIIYIIFIAKLEILDTTVLQCVLWFPSYQIY